MEHSEQKLAYLRRILAGKVTGFTSEELRQAHALVHAGLITGRRVIFDGSAVELLYLVESLEDGAQVWMLRPLFVDEPEYEGEIRLSDRLVDIHAKYA